MEINSSSSDSDKDSKNSISNSSSKSKDKNKNNSINKSINEEEQITNYYNYIDECQRTIEDSRQNYVNSLEEL